MGLPQAKEAKLGRVEPLYATFKCWHVRMSENKQKSCSQGAHI